MPAIANSTWSGKRRIEQRLSQVAPFAQWRHGQRHRLAWAGRHLRVPSGEAFLRHADCAGGVYVLLAGQASVIAPGQPVFAVRPGDVVGARDVLAGRARSATIRADSELELLWLTDDEFTEIAACMPKLRELAVRQPAAC